MEKKIITISREFGSGGRSVGHMVAERLGIPFYDKELYAIIVSGYSGSDLLAGQLVTALNMNKTFYLPGNFCMMETANNAGAAMKLPGIEDRIKEFSEKMTHTLVKETE